MAIERKKLTCFVVMPFGEKTDASGEEIDFDDIYRFFFKKVIDGMDLGLECIRCDEIAEAGSIHETMFEHIYQADVVVVDITSANPNVFYELGVRHALARSVTVLIRRKGTAIPFNIQGLQVVEYDQRRFASIERAKERIQEIIRNGLRTRRNDSPIHTALPLNIIGPSKAIGETRTIRYPLLDSEKKPIDKKAICLVTGDIQNVKGIDVWVNSENTNMQMARPLDDSISGIIRYLGSEKKSGKMVCDTIANELADRMKGRGDSVIPGEIVVTSSGSLAQTHQVKLIFHAAAVFGQVGKGYFPITDITSCVTNALRKVDFRDKQEYGETNVASILFPLMGTRAANSDFEGRLKALLEAAVDYLASNDSKVEKACFLTYSNKELEVCLSLLDANPKLAEPVEEKKPPLPPASTQAPADGLADPPSKAAPGAAPAGEPAKPAPNGPKA